MPVRPTEYAFLLAPRYFPTNVGNISDAQQYRLDETSPSSKLRGWIIPAMDETMTMLPLADIPPRRPRVRTRQIRLHPVPAPRGRAVAHDLRQHLDADDFVCVLLCAGAHSAVGCAAELEVGGAFGGAKGDVGSTT